MFCLRYLCLFTYSGDQHILCCCLVFSFFILCTLCFPALFFFHCPFILDLQLPMQSVPLTTDVVSSNLDQGEVYNIM